MASLRADIVARRTYQRLKDDGTYESWLDVVDRCVSHQYWLWDRAVQQHGKGAVDPDELASLTNLLMNRTALLAGRTLWMGGTEKIKEREIANFNCSGERVETVHDMVDFFWLLLNGCGVGGVPTRGSLSGFMTPIKEIEVIRSTKKGEERGNPHNKEEFKDGVWYLRIGDSGEAWAKSLGKLLAGKYPARKIILDFSQIREAGTRLAGYGWISSGDEVIAQEYPKIINLMSKRAGRLLTKLDIMEICNHLGVIQTGRRGAEIMLMDYGDPEWHEFTQFKKDMYSLGRDHREQSNNSLMFWGHPGRDRIKDLFELIQESGGSEPGIINASAATERAPWFATVNPCAEILLANKGFCNLVTINVAAFPNFDELLNTIYLMARANYRQTLVNLDDGILQRSWHENNEFLRLCGVSLTGVTQRPDLGAYEYRQMRAMAQYGAMSQALELGTQIPKNVTTIKPSGTTAKIMDAKDGCHEAVGKYIFNNIAFSKHDPLVPMLIEHGYHAEEKGADSIIIRFPVKYDDGNFTEVDGMHVNLESAVSQLERYRMLQKNWSDQNTSITVRYDEDEIPDMVDWLDSHWDEYVGVSFIPREDPTKTAEELGYSYLPQQPVTQEQYNTYVSRLTNFDVDDISGGAEDELNDVDCENGVCPIR